MQEKNGTIEELFKEFGLDCDTMEVGVPYDVHESDIEIEAFDEKLNKKVFAKVKNAIKKPIQSSFRIKLKNRKDFEEPMAGDHFIAITHHDTGKIDYTFVKDLINGMNVITENGEDEIENIESLSEDYVYDIETETGNYFTNGILSHNTMMSHAITTTGGYALRYAASTLNRVKKVCDLKDGTGKMIGIQMNVRNYKNKTGIPFRENDMWLYFDRGFDAEGEYIDLVKELQTDPRITALCKIGGAYWKSDKWGWSYKSKDSFISDFVHNEACKDMWEEMKNVIDEVLSGAIESDKETGDPEQMAEQNETYMDSAEARAEINSYKEVEQVTQDSIVKKEDGLVTESETPEVTLSEVD